MAKTDKVVLVLEKSSENLKSVKDGNDIILEGIFAQFGVTNNNDRIYEEEEYLPHLEYLNKKINEKRLIGELDHPEKFDISLSKISHVIESLEYNKETRTIKGRVRLLDTPQGRVAKTLVESGVPISISSRAAGLVESNKHVKIKKIFTYDLVADPGFENAVLSKMNESLGILNENVAIYDVTSKYPEMLENFTDKKINQPMNPSTKYVTTDELNTYSMLLKEEIESIQESISSLSINENKDANTSEMNTTVNKLVEYTKYIAGVLQENIQKQDTSIKYADYLKQELEKSVDYSNYLKECIERGVSYAEYVAEKANEGINNNIKYTEYVAEKANEGIKYAEYIAEQANKGIEYSEYIAEQASKGIKYSEYIGESLSQEIGDVAKYADYLGESLEKGIEYSEYIAEQTQQVADYTEYALHESKTTKTETGKQPTDYSSLDEKVNNILSSIKKQKVDEVSIKLDEAAKQRVSTDLNENSQQKADKELANALSTGNVENRWLDEAPEQFKTIWETLDESTKADINAQSKTYNLSTPYQIKNFWETRTLTKKKEDAAVNESKTTELPKIGYSNEYLEKIAKSLDKFKK